jgi:hypothetical protein
VKKHGMSHTKLSRAWINMKSRCNSDHEAYYRWYKAKGIGVCSEWESSFEAFMEWALENGYKEGLTLDRIKEDKGYQPDNCRWISRSENIGRAGRGKKDKGARMIEFRGREQSLNDWSKELGIKYVTLYQRLKRMTVDEAFTKPLKSS